MNEEAPTIWTARYSKGRVIMCCPSDGSGLKTRAMCLAEAFGGKYVHRSGGYNMAPGRAQEALRLWHLGYDANIRMFAHDKRRTAELLIPPEREARS